MVSSIQSSLNNDVNFEIGDDADSDKPEQNNSNSTVDQAQIETDLSNALSDEGGEKVFDEVGEARNVDGRKEVEQVEIVSEKKLSSCYLCIKVNHNKNVVDVPMDRKMRNKLRSEFWFQIYDDW